MLLIRLARLPDRGPQDAGTSADERCCTAGIQSSTVTAHNTAHNVFIRKTTQESLIASNPNYVNNLRILKHFLCSPLESKSSSTPDANGIGIKETSSPKMLGTNIIALECVVIHTLCGFDTQTLKSLDFVWFSSINV